MVSTLDFESNNPSSNLGMSSFFVFINKRPILPAQVKIKGKRDRLKQLKVNYHSMPKV